VRQEMRAAISSNCFRKRMTPPVTPASEAVRIFCSRSATEAKGTSLFTSERLIALEDAQQVLTDCSSVNPSS
jgi:hypothetical protein